VRLREILPARVWLLLLIPVSAFGVAFFCDGKDHQVFAGHPVERSLEISAARLLETLEASEGARDLSQHLSMEPSPTVIAWTAMAFPDAVQSIWVESPGGLILYRSSIKAAKASQGHLKESRQAVGDFGYLVASYYPQVSPGSARSVLSNRWWCATIISVALWFVVTLSVFLRHRL
jgi:hypothetical protein